MFYLNKDNIEEMFRDAAEKYQLPTDAAFDWEKIEVALEQERVNAIELSNRKKNKKRRFVIWYLLLIPLGWFANYAWNNHLENGTELKNLVRQDKIEKINQEEKTGSSDNKNTKLQQADQSNTATLINQEKNILTSKAFEVSKISQSIQTGININILKSSEYDNSIAPVNSNNNNLPFHIADLTAATITNNAIDIKQEKIKEQASPSLQENKVVIKKQNTGFYAGLVFSPDISFIKFQETAGMGYSVGFIGGYRFNNRWSIETGLLSSMKKYYTSGEYFDKTNVAYLNDKELVSAKGKCNMIEIPLNAKYTLSQEKRGKWTATIGISSYFVNKESYNYEVIENGQPERSEHTYYHSDHQVTAVLNLATGYQRNIGNGLELRLEPYYKLPLSGMGTGKLYLSSIGLNIGITKNFR